VKSRRIYRSGENPFIASDRDFAGPARPSIQNPENLARWPLPRSGVELHSRAVRSWHSSSSTDGQLKPAHCTTSNRDPLDVVERISSPLLASPLQAEPAAELDALLHAMVDSAGALNGANR